MKINIVLDLENINNTKTLRFSLESIKKQTKKIDSVVIINKNNYNIESILWYSRYLQLQTICCKEYVTNQEELTIFSNSNCIFPINFIKNYFECVSEKDIIYTGCTVQTTDDYLIYYYPSFHDLEKIFRNNTLRQISETNKDNYAIYGNPKDKIMSRADLYNIRIYPVYE